MNLAGMREIVRRDLHDEDESGYRWTDSELDRHIAHAVRDFSEAIPLEEKTSLTTSSGSREIDISSLTDLVMVEAVEYPLDHFPKSYQRFSLWAGKLTLLGAEVPDGSDADVYYGKLHTLDSEASTIPTRYEDLIATGAAGYAALEWAVYAVNQVNVGGEATQRQFLTLGREKLREFRRELDRFSRRNRVRLGQLYEPYRLPVSKTTDPGP
ncbi:MAG: hypothetical protein V1894_05980 [Chloroflexota bacterium]